VREKANVSNALERMHSNCPPHHHYHRTYAHGVELYVAVTERTPARKHANVALACLLLCRVLNSRYSAERRKAAKKRYANPLTVLRCAVTY
jgi:hypothetical protein